MNQKLWSSVDAYFANQLIPNDPVLDAVILANEKAGLPPHDVSPSQGKLLQLLARMTNASRILEIGTLGAYSSIWLARTLPENGCLITLEADPQHAEVAISNIKSAGLSRLVDVRVGKALDTLPDLYESQKAPFDFVFIDADKVNNPHYYQWARKLTTKGSIILIDNVVRKGAVTNPDSQDPSVQGVQQVHEIISSDTGVSATTIQTVGEKGYDGFTLIVA